VADQASRDVVDEIAQVRTGRGDRPVEPVVIDSVTIDSGTIDSGTTRVSQTPNAGPDFSPPDLLPVIAIRSG
jgi:hypothetical protein